MVGFCVKYVSPILAIWLLASCQGLLGDEHNAVGLNTSLQDEREESLKQLREIELLRDEISEYTEQLELEEPLPVKEIIKGRQVVESLSLSQEQHMEWLADKSLQNSSHATHTPVGNKRLREIRELNDQGMRSIADAKAFVITHM